MSDSKKVSEKDLRKLEDEAYFELRQIIDEAMQLQNIDLLNARIASWKSKYKKLLDRPSTSSRSDFKKRIEFLLNQYYSSVTQYILNQLKLEEEKKVENQAKALRELYRLIKDTNDYDLLKKKVKKWEEKYPIDGFLRMYQKRIELYTRDKNLRENAFKQEEAFNDLVDITKIYGTLDELKDAVSLWEKKYSINDKYSIDDFIKHQSEVKRFTSDEFLQSIARDDPKPDNISKTEVDVAKEYNNRSFSDLSVQASAYASLVAISKSPNNINEMFRWVYKNNNIKFNDKYKELILSATYLDYSPTYLNKLAKPNMDMSKSSLSFDEYKNMDDIKRYAIISYFNLLLPPDKAISNDYFDKHIQVIYSKSERARVTNDIKGDPNSIENVINSGIEISLANHHTNDTIDDSVSDSSLKSDTLENIPEEIPGKIPDEIDSDTIIPSSTEEDTKSNTAVELSATKLELNLNSEISKYDEPLSIVEESAPVQIEPSNFSYKEEEKEINDKSDSKDISIENNDEEITDIDNEDIIDVNDKESQSIGTNSEINKTIDVIYEKPQFELFSENNSETTDYHTYIGDEQTNNILDLDTNQEMISNSESSHSISDKDNFEDQLDYETIVYFSPMFFAAINSYDKQAVRINNIDAVVNKYVQSEKSRNIELDTSVKTKSNIE